MDWPTAVIRIVQECKGVLNGITFAILLFATAAIVKAARGK